MEAAAQVESAMSENFLVLGAELCALLAWTESRVRWHSGYMALVVQRGPSEHEWGFREFSKPRDMAAIYSGRT